MLLKRITAPLALLLAGGMVDAANPPAVFTFREPQLRSYRVEAGSTPATLASSFVDGEGRRWLRARLENGPTNLVEFSSRVVVQIEAGVRLEPMIADRPLRLARTLPPGTFILEAGDPLTAAQQAASLARLPGVIAAYPVARRQWNLHGPYARPPNDPYFSPPGAALADRQWHLENRDEQGNSAGSDLNTRAAWPFTRGEGVTVAVADDGFEMTHPDLTARTTNAPHLNFHTLGTNVGPSGSFSDHATAVAGLIAATGDNRVGISGVAPKATLANWVLFDRFSFLPDEERLMDAFQYASNIVRVQNHSWGNAAASPLRPSTIEEIGISNAVAFGREGRGTIFVRSAGNSRDKTSSNVNDDGYASDPRVIAVAAVRADGYVTRYSNPGACVLVAAPSGDEEATENPCLGNTPNLFTTDRTGSQGYNRGFFSNDLANYAYGDTGFSGTSGSAPQISGVVALLLSANPLLTYRDVQQILVLSARHFRTNHPGLRANGAGLLVSHDLGYGVPDAGVAVQLARGWSNRPALVQITRSSEDRLPIPDLGLRVMVEGAAVPLELASVPSLAATALHPDTSTEFLPVQDIGLANRAIERDLRGTIAFIQRGDNFFCDKLSRAARAGAALGIVYNNRDRTERILMGGTDLATIPAVMINQNEGEALAALLAADPTIRMRLDFQPARYTFAVTEPLLCEHVGVRVRTDHTRRRDVRITLLSPMGTRSVLQHVNADNLPGPSDWTYYSTQHFFESSVGDWIVEISDEDDSGVGTVLGVELTIRGVPIEDSDADGLDDAWERHHFGHLQHGPGDDPDGDGYSNAREQIMGTDPARPGRLLTADLSVYNERLARLSWPARPGEVFRVRFGRETPALLSVITNVPGRFPETEWFVPYEGNLNGFFQIEAISGPR